VLAALLVPYAGLLEITQVYSPGRDASVLDFTASSAGIAAAVLLLPLAWRAMTWMFAAAPAGVSRGGQPPL
jgi:VanZ family protein